MSPGDRVTWVATWVAHIACGIVGAMALAGIVWTGYRMARGLPIDRPDDHLVSIFALALMTELAAHLVYTAHLVFSRRLNPKDREELWRLYVIGQGYGTWRRMMRDLRERRSRGSAR